MRILLTIVAVFAVASMAHAAKEPQAPVQVLEAECGLVNICTEIDFGSSDGGFTGGNSCDPTGGAAVWAWGAATIPAPPEFGPNVWGTVLGANYPNNAGDGLLSPPIDVTASCYLLEVLHYFHCETNFDGGNVVVIDGSGGETVAAPVTGYPATISTSTGFYAFCVDAEPGFTGNSSSGPSIPWGYTCWDLTSYIGQTIQVRLDFGTDSSVTYPGWYVAGARLGGIGGTPVESATWGQIKNLY